MLNKNQGLGSQFTKLLLIVVVLEASLGGGGRLTEVGELTLRMLLFGICMTYVAFRLAIPSNTGKLPVFVWLLLFLFLAVISFGVMIGVAKGASIEGLVNDISPLIYFPMILFFAFAIRNDNDINRIALLLVASGIVLALAYLLFFFVVLVGFLPFSAIYGSLNETGEFFFRGADGSFVGFFYKGFLFLCIGFLFVLLHPDLRCKWMALLIFLAIVLTFTRGFLLALLLTLVYGAILESKSRWYFLFALLLFLTIAAAFVSINPDIFRLLLRPDSDIIRLNDISYIFDQIDTRMLFFGDGFGAEINGRYTIEITYFQVLYKQGLIGVSFWVILLFINYWIFKRVPSNMRRSALVFHLAAIFVYFQSATNPFLTNPIGMSIVLISTVVLWRMLQSEGRVVN